MKTLILAAHGSRLAESNAEVERLADQLRGLLHDRGYAVTAAFLELTEPGIEDAIRDHVSGGCERFVLLPYFLAAGRHVREDLPAIVARLEAEFPAVNITLLAHFGQQPGVAELLADMLSRGSASPAAAAADAPGR